MALKPATSRLFISRFLLISIGLSLVLFFYLVYPLFHNLNDLSSLNDQFLSRLWKYKFLFVLPVWLFMTYRNMRNCKTSGIVQTGVTSILLVPGILVLIELIEGGVNLGNLHYMILFAATLISFLLLRKLHRVYHFEEHQFKTFHYLLAILFVISFTVLNFVYN